MTTLTLLLFVVVIALVFEFINGFHDTANAIATVVSTGVLRARTAVLMAAVLNVIGAFWGSAVASTIGKDLLDPTEVTQHLVLAALLAAIAWNLFTWYFGIPSSSSHALVGGMIGAGWYTLGRNHLQPTGIEKVATALVVSPVAGFAAAFVAMVAMYWGVRRARPAKVNAAFRRLQLVSAGFMALSHGTSDAQKTMGIVTMALLSYKAGLSPEAQAALPRWVFGAQAYDPGGAFDVPTWVVVTCALVMGFGTAAGGWRIIHTMGTKIFKLRPIHGFCAETAAATVLQVAAFFGLPTSTTHCITAAIMGAGATTRLSAVSWGLTRRILWVWLLTLPMCAALAVLCCAALERVGL